MKKLFAFVLITALLLSGCNAQTSDVSGWKDQAYYPAETNAASIEMDEMGFDNDYAEAPAGEAANVPQGRKWVITMSVDAETEDLDSALAALLQKVTAMGGYVERQSVSSGSGYSSYRYREAYVTIRIPADQADAFVSEVGGLTNITHSNKNLDDITLQYVATDSRITALTTEQNRLLELLAQAENLYDILEIENRLTDVRYELEYYNSQMRIMDNQVDYATISLNLTEVREYTPVEAPSFGQRIVDGFTGNLQDLKEGIEDFIVWFVSHSPTIALFAVIIVVLVVIEKKSRPNRMRKRAAKKAKQEPKETEEE